VTLRGAFDPVKRAAMGSNAPRPGLDVVRFSGMSETEPRRWAKPPAPVEVDVVCTIDGEPFVFTTWSDMSALLAVRLNGKHGKPRRGCEAGTCGACESTLNGAVVRLCQTRPTELCGADVITGDN
jgi:hypothetical protein